MDPQNKRHSDVRYCNSLFLATHLGAGKLHCNVYPMGLRGWRALWIKFFLGFLFFFRWVSLFVCFCSLFVCLFRCGYLFVCLFRCGHLFVCVCFWERWVLLGCFLYSAVFIFFFINTEMLCRFIIFIVFTYMSIKPHLMKFTSQVSISRNLWIRPKCTSTNMI